MIKRFLTNILIKWYVNKNRVIEKMLPADELDAFLFKSSDSVEKVLKYEMTNLTLKYFEASKNEQDFIKGAALAYRLLLDRHRKAKYLQDNMKNKDNMIKIWNNYKLSSWNGSQPK